MPKSLIEQLRNLIPEMECKGLCMESCGPIDYSDRERELIKQYCEKNGIPYHEIPRITVEKLIGHLVADPNDLACPYLKDSKCTIYAERPLICRLWGVAKSMPCMFGCKPKRVLNDKEAHHILERAEV